jgi:antitoxin (DNA-binding transcriptional repressor) of toxin-antitoxin stability system
MIADDKIRFTTMDRYTLKDAQTHLQQLLEDARHGKTVVILDENDQAVQLVPIPTTTNLQPREPGSARGLMEIADDFDAPLEDFNEYME